MLFSSSLFLFLFLPIVVAAYHALNPPLRNSFLLLASVVFYAWGEPIAVAILLAITLANWAFALAVERYRGTTAAVVAVAAAVVVDLSLLIGLKYANWFWSLGSDLLLAMGAIGSQLPPLGDVLPAKGFLRELLIAEDGTVRLPIGISFMTFHALSYVIDIHRKKAEVQRNPATVGLYFALFPQLVAGPIVRYSDVAAQFARRIVTREDFAHGFRRFVVGLGKKALIADSCGAIADSIFAVPAADLPAATAWLGITAYTLQIYFDFSGYSDMALGLGRLFGFRFLENFLHPYASRSLTEFWRRWHISLSTWFRDYLYIPLGGNRHGAIRTATNLVIVFFLCGLWHGASFNFIVWGLLHGSFLVLEKSRFGDWLDRLPRVLRHVYVMAVVMTGWVFFRADDLPHAMYWLSALVSPDRGLEAWSVELWLDPWNVTMLAAGVVGSAPWLPRAAALVRDWRARGRFAPWIAAECAATIGWIAVLVASACVLAAGTYQPFIYFRF
jgi:alginate O-acetyltransferase complex protein AlgI